MRKTLKKTTLGKKTLSNSSAETPWFGNNITDNEKVPAAPLRGPGKIDSSSRGVFMGTPAESIGSATKEKFDRQDRRSFILGSLRPEKLSELSEELEQDAKVILYCYDKNLTALREHYQTLGALYNQLESEKSSNELAEDSQRISRVMSTYHWQKGEIYARAYLKNSSKRMEEITSAIRTLEGHLLYFAKKQTRLDKYIDEIYDAIKYDSFTLENEEGILSLSKKVHAEAIDEYIKTRINPIKYFCPDSPEYDGEASSLGSSIAQEKSKEEIVVTTPQTDPQRKKGKVVDEHARNEQKKHYSFPEDKREVRTPRRNLEKYFTAQAPRREKSQEIPPPIAKKTRMPEQKRDAKSLNGNTVRSVGTSDWRKRVLDKPLNLPCAVRS